MFLLLYIGSAGWVRKELEQVRRTTITDYLTGDSNVWRVVGSHLSQEFYGNSESVRRCSRFADRSFFDVPSKRNCRSGPDFVFVAHPKLRMPCLFQSSTSSALPWAMALRASAMGEPTSFFLIVPRLSLGQDTIANSQVLQY